MSWKFAIGVVLAILVSGSAIAQEGQSVPHDTVLYAPHNAVLYGFANASDLSTLVEGPVKGDVQPSCSRGEQFCD
jgi:hypothetical protein